MTKSPIQASSGLVLIDKPAGITSHDVVAQLRKTLGTRRVGHAGTLDPMATGLLVLGVDAGTKLLNYLTGAGKTYLATIRLGWSTTSDDADGERLTENLATASELANITDESVLEHINAFLGEQMQRPSSVSAIRVAGQRAYDLVRSGVEVQLEPRKVQIFEISMLGLPRRNPEAGNVDIDVRVSCSSGTYIRAIARDLGERLGVGGHLVALRRTKVGPFDIESATELNAPVLISLSRSVEYLMPVRRVSGLEASELRLGRTLPKEQGATPSQMIAAVGEQDELVAVMEATRDALQPRWVVAER